MQAFGVTTLLVTLASSFWACSRPSGTLSSSESALTPQALPGLPLQIDLPSDAKVQPIASGVSIFIHPGRRSPLGIDIVRDDTRGAFLGPNAETRALTPSLQLTYREQVLSGGSGGDEGIVDGVLTLATKTYRITCRQQSEWSPSARACLPILATLRSFSPNK
jgi:hypothetical protein